ncbi:MAG: hypothetical protein RLZZ111_2218 [Planctomycetota bacterium]|jgi:lipopolysaccharide transport system ATP-binding protein
MTAPIISVEGLGKRYRLRHQSRPPYTTFRDALAQGARRLLSGTRRAGADDASVEDFWALEDVSFDVAQGAVVGIIGRNGAGKSTLLKILSRITEPTTGRVRLRGRVASLLEVGTGFHPELTGRENIFLNGAILGMSRAEISRRFDEIVAFAEVDRFLDTPVKHYSSGMYTRLAFAVAAHLDPEILVVDEVLAVGDAQFQAKCLARMRTVADHGRTVLFVSHNMLAVSSLCTRGLLLERGRLAVAGAVEEVVAAYQRSGAGTAATVRRDNQAGAPLFIAEVSAALEDAPPGHRLVVDAVLADAGDHRDAFVAYDIVAASGICIMQALPTQEGFLRAVRGRHRLRVEIDLPPLIPGSYLVTMWVGSHYSQTLDLAKECVEFQVDRSPTPGRTVPHTIDHGHVVPRSTIRSHEVVETGAGGPEAPSP